MAQTIHAKTGEWEMVIGCEVHAQIATQSKLFSRSAVKFGARQNSQVSLVDAAMPGMLPVINEYAVGQAVRTGLGLNAKINLRSIFDRKNYFYPDLPQGYQISQFGDPVVGLGELEIDLANGEKKRIGITRLHLEQDAGKSIHDQSPTQSYIDLNRSGVALMEIVSEPDISDADEAADYIRKLRAVLRCLGTCDGDMEKGNLRCDANVSVRKVGDKNLGTRCEIKNLNSIRNIIRAINYEAQRQIDILEDGGRIAQETRLFDAIEGVTKTMRDKEDAMDYRYSPDPDLPVLEISGEFVEKIRSSLPELPHIKKQRYISELKIPEYDAGVLTSDMAISDYFEELIKKHDIRLSTTWLSVELLGRINRLAIDLEECRVDPNKMSGLLALIEDGTISGKIAKDVLDVMVETGKNADDIVEEKGLKQVSDTGAIEKMVDEVLSANADKVEQYKNGQEKLFGFFVGQVMKASQGKANPKTVNEILKDKLK